MSALSSVQRTYTPSSIARESLLARLTARNIAGLIRYLTLRLRYPHLRVGLFFVDRGYNIEIGPEAQVRFGVGVRFMRDCTVDFRQQVTIGDNVYFNRGCSVISYSSLTIGDNCLFGEGVSIHDENHVVGCGPEPIASLGFTTAPIVIGRNVWVGAKATILQGVTIGDNAVIGAHAVVTRDVPANTVAVGVPARVVREL